MQDAPPTVQGPIPPQTPREAGSRPARIIAWTATLGLVILIAMMQRMGGVSADPEAPLPADMTTEVAGPSAMLEVFGKYAVWGVELESNPFFGGGPSIGPQLVAPMESLATSDADRLRIAMVAGEVVGAEDALERIDKLGSELPGPLASDAATLRVIYTEGVDAVGPEARASLEAGHGWFADLALVFGADDETRSPVIRAANKVGATMVAAIILVCIVGFAGLGLFAFALWMALMGKLKLHYQRPSGMGSVGIETFGLFLASFLALQIVMGVLYQLIGDPVVAVSPWVNWLLLLVAFYPLLRGVRMAEVRQALGWHRGRGVFREIGAGIVGYMAGAPVVAFGIGLVFLLGLLQEMFTGAQGPPPSHPLPDELGAGGAWTAIQLVILATVWAPVVEETIFRGALYHHLRGGMNAVLSGLITAFLFAAIHPQGLIAIPALMSLGFVFAMLREWRGSIIASITAHALNNGMVVTMLLFLFSA